MPELPEVETVRTGLSAVLPGLTVMDVKVLRRDLRKPVPESISDIKGCVVRNITRRAKYLCFHFSGDYVMVSHLGMSGLWLLRGSGQCNRHDHLIIAMDNDQDLVFHDPRRFGMADISTEQELDMYPAFKRLGAECFAGVTGEYLHRKAEGSHRSVKTFLLDQSVIAGLGNIYVCESLWYAGISPAREAGTVSYKEFCNLVAASENTLKKALDAGGSSLKDFRHADGNPGRFQHSFAVYAREGMPCLRDKCSGSVSRHVQSGRSSFYCPVCQK